MVEVVRRAFLEDRYPSGREEWKDVGTNVGMIDRAQRAVAAHRKVSRILGSV